MKLSARQQKKFYARRDLVTTTFSHSKHMLYPINEGSFAAIILNQRFAFRHIFKNGGTSIIKQTQHKQVSMRLVEDKQLVAVVRDPIDHFLSGWAECGSRFPKKMAPAQNETYDGRILSWLEQTKMNLDSFKYPCTVHSIPQANYFLTGNGTVRHSFVLVGDLYEMPGLLGLVGFQYDTQIPIGRDSSVSVIKQLHFQKQKHLL
eukprot:CAMPEP_0194331604 /NCGR_PEP_ID=MMETSP0171-20130528/56101_1 /TAXON_ID=218684 /ORGANISM="Corethron pennatum, Strain L29A3" /LENGTH=203 /DNA_ID=CAMNT_0039093129 /DNA_START=87 /DNA_END=695 /DNA_ORIENTATION=-